MQKPPACLRDREMRRMARASSALALRRMATHPKNIPPQNNAPGTPDRCLPRRYIPARPVPCFSNCASREPRAERDLGKLRSVGQARKLARSLYQIPGPCIKMAGSVVETESEAFRRILPIRWLRLRECRGLRQASAARPARSPACANLKSPPSTMKSGSQASSERESAVARLESRNTKPSRDLIALAASSGATGMVAENVADNSGFIARKGPPKSSPSRCCSA